ncbi:MAG: hypothetical protein H7330_11840 [Hymenobacteraceae bacterium]|nr:hypothetical protein [Hymenobacteraceae bacterium]
MKVLSVLPALVASLLLTTVSVAVAPGPGPFAEFLKTLRQKLTWFNQRVPNTRVFVVTDKTLYAPGESIWLTAFVREGAALVPATSQQGEAVTVELLDPKRAPAATIRLEIDKHGLAKGDFQLTEAMPGGLYKLRAFTDRMNGRKEDSSVAPFSKTLTVQSVTLPRVKLTLDFPRKGYGPGDEVLATLKAFGNDNQPLAGRGVTFLAQVAGVAVADGKATIGPDGIAALRFTLPKNLASPDGVLTVTLPHEGLTESVARAVPIVLNDIRVDLLPEGGDLVEGLAGRVAVRAVNEHGEPADVAGSVYDDRDRRLTTFRTVHDGLAIFDLTPAAGRRYHVRLTEPVASEKRVAVPAPLPGGFGLHVEHQQNQGLPISISSTVREKVLLVGVQRGELVIERTLDVRPGKPTAFQLPLDKLAPGVLQLTLFDSKKIARAERLAFINADKKLRLTVTPTKANYAPREKVTLRVQALDERGLPVPNAALAIRVVDDQNSAFADDKQSTLASWLLAEADLRDAVKEPRWYFDPEHAKEAPAALDLVLLTHGWRRFTWEQVQQETAPPPPHVYYAHDRMMPMAAMGANDDRAPRRARGEPEMAVNQPANNQAEARELLEERVAMAAAPVAAEAGEPDAVATKMAAPPADARRQPDGGVPVLRRPWPILPPRPAPTPAPGAYYRTRTFAAPIYDKPQKPDQERTDFRSTLYWAPAVVTDRAGRAEISFYNADAITSYRATAEGLSAEGLPGVAETRFFTQPPLALAVKLPPHVVLGDEVGIPVVIANHTDQALTGPLTVQVPISWQLKGIPFPSTVTIPPRGAQTLTGHFVVGGAEGAAEIAVTFGNAGSPLRDAFRQPIAVLLPGYPVSRAFSGNEAKRTYTLDAAGALPGTLRVSLTAFPSVESDLLKGIAAILREPSGCFEQTSTTSYPNVLALEYLQQQRNPTAETQASIARAEALLDRGYAKLTGFETKEKGYEWFGGSPAHEALTAYGLLQFADMRRVRPGAVSSAMVDRTHAWLMARRDGKGGFQKSTQALDQFGRADDDITNAYIVYSLVEAGYRDVQTELDAATAKAAQSGDPYQLALLANAQLTLKQEGVARPLLAALYAKQGADGAWTGAKHSVTYSTGEALRVETTALALLATLKDERRPGQALNAGARFLIGARSGPGNFSSTQGTILALKALTAYSLFAQQTTENGAVTVWVDGKEAGTATYQAGQKSEVLIKGLEAALNAAGPHQVEVRYAASVKSPLPYTLAADWRTERAPSDAQCAVRLVTSLAAGGAGRVGESVRLTATLTNLDPDRGQPMTMALLGLPAGLTPQPWQLKQLQERGIFDFYELKDGRLACYYRDLKPGEKVEITLDLKAEVSGTFVAPASVAYLYYTDERKCWVPGVVAKVKA